MAKRRAKGQARLFNDPEYDCYKAERERLKLGGKMPLSMLELDELMDKIADRWGGKDCPRSWSRNHKVFKFSEGTGPETGFMYFAYAPGEAFAMFEDSGRPCGQIRRNDAILVRAVNDAPDANWSVSLDGIYVGHSGVPEQL